VPCHDDHQDREIEYVFDAEEPKEQQMHKHARAAMVVIGLAAVAAWPVAAHHSHAMFDHSKEESVTGTVTAFLYRNPHVFLYLDAKAADGKVVNWAVEMSNIANMESRGIFASTFRPGDVVTVKVHRLRDGRAGGNYVSVVAADGKTYD
jgi:hypothetical protein